MFLPDGSARRFSMNFVLPLAYRNNGEVRIILYLRSPEAPCKVRLVPVQLVRKRIGSPIVDNLTGLSGGGPLVDLPANVLVAKTFILKAGGPLAGQMPGDAFTVRIERQANDPTDTCNGNVFVEATDIRYALR
jgi:hypothetical protein